MAMAGRPVLDCAGLLQQLRAEAGLTQEKQTEPGPLLTSAEAVGLVRHWPSGLVV